MPPYESGRKIRKRNGKRKHYREQFSPYNNFHPHLKVNQKCDIQDFFLFFQCKKMSDEYADVSDNSRSNSPLSSHVRVTFYLKFKNILYNIKDDTV